MTNVFTYGTGWYWVVLTCACWPHGVFWQPAAARPQRPAVSCACCCPLRLPSAARGLAQPWTSSAVLLPSGPPLPAPSPVQEPYIIAQKGCPFVWCLVPYIGPVQEPYIKGEKGVPVCVVSCARAIHYWIRQGASLCCLLCKSCTLCGQKREREEEASRSGILSRGLKYSERGLSGEPAGLSGGKRRSITALLLCVSDCAV